MPRYVPSLDGLRAIAVLLVLWCHVPETVAGYPDWLRIARWLVGPGGLGVELFFALSGFLITRILLAEREAEQPVRWFLMRRLLRIFPIYYLLLAVMVFDRPPTEIGWCALYLGNFADVFAPTPGPKPLGHTWSLCVEEHFYLLWPFVVAFASRATSRRVLMWFVIPASVLGAVAVGYSTEPRFAEWAIERLSPFRFLTLAGGALVAYAEPGLRADPRRILRVGLLLTALGLLLHPKLWFLYVPVFVLEATHWPMELAPAFVRVHSVVLCTGILIWCLTPAGRLGSPQRLLAIAPLRWIGRISYGLYLYHLPIYHALLHAEPTPVRALWTVGLTFVVATASFFVIERPILGYAGRFRNRRR